MFIQTAFFLLGSYYQKIKTKLQNLTTNNNFKLNLFEFFKSSFNYNRRIRLIEIDFDRPWWNVLLRQKTALILFGSGVLIQSLTATILPYLIINSLEEKNVISFTLIILAIIVWQILSHFLLYFEPLVTIQTMYSVEYSAHTSLLLTNQTIHTTRFLDNINSKISHGSKAFDTFFSFFAFDVLSLVGAVIGLVFWLNRLSTSWALQSLFFVLAILSLNIVVFRLRKVVFHKIRIEAEDKSKALSLESMSQISFIRAPFATIEQLKKVREGVWTARYILAMGWRTGAFVISATSIIFLLSFILLGVQMINSSLNSVTILGVLLVNLSVGARLGILGNKINRIFTCVADIQDLFDFIRSYKKQTFPVIPEQELGKKADPKKHFKKIIDQVLRGEEVILENFSEIQKTLFNPVSNSKTQSDSKPDLDKTLDAAPIKNKTVQQAQKPSFMTPLPLIEISKSKQNNYVWF